MEEGESSEVFGVGSVEGFDVVFQKSGSQVAVVYFLLAFDVVMSGQFDASRESFFCGNYQNAGWMDDN